MNETKSGWERLDCSFFTPICRGVLGPYFETQGFVEKELTPGGGILYSMLRVFLEISYEPETSPNYSPTVIIGTGGKLYDEAGRLSGVPFWYLIQESLPERMYTFWTFKVQRDLESVLSRIKMDILEPYGKPLWLDPDRLETLISEFRARPV